LKLSLISLFPSLVSVIFTTGVIAIFNIEIDIYTIIFIAVTMGLTIDYTIHIIVAINEMKKSPDMKDVSLHSRSGIQKYFSYIIRFSGIPVFLSFLTSLFSFGILLFSSFKGARFFGLLISLSLVISILFSVIILPALLIEKDRKSFN
jgi:predicted RND superfamily exporter protein